MPKNGKAEIVKDALRRFPTLPLLTISKYILNTHGLPFDNNLDKIRFAVRYHSGRTGDRDRQLLSDKSLIRTPGHIVKLPKSWCREREPYHLKPKL